MLNKKLEQYLIKHEEIRYKPYLCPAGKLTIGVGRNIEDNGLTKDEIMYLLKNDIERCEKELKKIFTNFDNLPENVKIVLIDMIFNLGETRFKKFKKLIKAVKKRNWDRMIIEMKNSKWCRQVKKRCRDNVLLIEHLGDELSSNS